MNNRFFFPLLTALLAFNSFLPADALAHTQAGSISGGFSHGMWHPISGLDHLLAMSASGFLAYRLGKSARILLPACFLLFMTIGAYTGLFQTAWITPSTAETMIALSVVILGGLLALNSAFSLFFSALLLSGFAFFHGFAHGHEAGSEMGISFVIGFLLSTLLLHIGAMFVAKAFERRAKKQALPLIGKGIFATGLFFMIGLS